MKRITHGRFCRGPPKPQQAWPLTDFFCYALALLGKHTKRRPFEYFCLPRVMEVVKIRDN